jgi:hypothetical protein
MLHRSCAGIEISGLREERASTGSAEAVKIFMLAGRPQPRGLNKSIYKRGSRSGVRAKLKIQLEDAANERRGGGSVSPPPLVKKILKNNPMQSRALLWPSAAF